ncbi:MAG: hypothetical protein [Caudoviricetes sp.]|nr:MAG: hypothetical protein [Caudoviricetes sp.]
MKWLLNIIIICICNVIVWANAITYFVINAPYHLSIVGVLGYVLCTILCTGSLIITVISKKKFDTVDHKTEHDKS